MFEKVKFIIILLIAVVLIAVLIPWNNITQNFKFELIKKENLRINFNLADPSITTVSADSSNFLALNAEVRNSSGAPIPNARVKFSVDDSKGIIYPKEARTDKYGVCMVKYIPPESSNKLFEAGKVSARLNAEIYSSSQKASLAVRLVPVPVILVHGYQATETVFTNFLEYLSSQGFSCSPLKYSSEAGIKKSSEALREFLNTQTDNYRKKGIQVKRYDVIAHSMGGLVTRYYSTSSDYIRSNNIRKIIFISVPQKGSPWASLGETYFNDQGIRDLVPDNNILTKDFPSMINKGLNNTIQIGSILGQYDEVVSPESSSLEEWDIKTEMFGVGENNLSFNNILNGKIAEATNHNGIISNKKVFEKVKTMLFTELPYPKQRN